MRESPIIRGAIFAMCLIEAALLRLA
jgi:hypothetical protein